MSPDAVAQRMLRYQERSNQTPFTVAATVAGMFARAFNLTEERFETLLDEMRRGWHTQL